MTADRKWMEQLGFELEDKGSMIQLWVVVDDCGCERPASLAEIVLWTSLTAPPAPVAPAEPIDMVLYCPACKQQHIDAADEIDPYPTPEKDAAWWDNPPHRSHLCHGCGHIWRPADVATNGVKAVKTVGKADSPVAAPAAPAKPTHLRRADGTLSGVFIETVASGAATVAADLRNWLDFLPGHAQPTIEQAVRLLETRP